MRTLRQSRCANAHVRGARRPVARGCSMRRFDAQSEGEGGGEGVMVRDGPPTVTFGCTLS